MPQPDPSLNCARDGRWNEQSRTWSTDAAATAWFAARGGQSGERPKEPEKDGRTPDDKDGNEELERELKEKPPTRKASSEASTSAATSTSASGRVWRDIESEDTGEWVATERFTLEDELEDTWPNVPSRYLDD